jgi:UDP-N-acetylmuramoyl-L-alanyl-D-glutamate--2,6-diaminopimelate ligase
MDAYLDAKLMLFDGRNGPAGGKLASAVINVDDPAADRVRAAAARGGRAVVGCGAARGAEVRIVRVEPRPEGLALTLDDHGVHAPVPLSLLGRYNAWNAAAAYAAARALGIERPLAERGLQRVAAIPGRLERLAAGSPFEVVVDYAHTPDALARALEACREHTAGRVLLVFGCGGDRDRGKRPLMGRIASEQSDAAWITSDNPRGEDPAAIAAEVAAGSTRALPVVLDRREAIAAALAAARPGDLVLIAGKGHETTQTIGARVLPFDDRAVAAELLSGRRTGA